MRPTRHRARWLVVASLPLLLGGCSGHGAAGPTVARTAVTGPTAGPTSVAPTGSGTPGTATAIAAPGGASSGAAPSSPSAPASPPVSRTTPGRTGTAPDDRPAPSPTGTARPAGGRPTGVLTVVPPTSRPTTSASAGTAADAGHGVAVQVTGSRRLQGSARGAGESSGDAIAITVRVDNESGRPLDLDAAVVSAALADGSQASAVSGAPAAPLHGALAAGDVVTAVYVFSLTPGAPARLTVSVSVNPAAAVSLFRVSA